MSSGRAHSLGKVLCFQRQKKSFLGQQEQAANTTLTHHYHLRWCGGPEDGFKGAPITDCWKQYRPILITGPSIPSVTNGLLAEPQICCTGQTERTLTILIDICGRRASQWPAESFFSGLLLEVCGPLLIPFCHWPHPGYVNQSWHATWACGVCLYEVVMSFRQKRLLATSSRVNYPGL